MLNSFVNVNYSFMTRIEEIRNDITLSRIIYNYAAYAFSNFK